MSTSMKTILEVMDKDNNWVISNDPIFPISKIMREYLGPLSSSPFLEQNYGLFAFLANVRNYNDVPINFPSRGLPKDHIIDTDSDRFISYFSPQELSDVSRYDSVFLSGHSFSWVTAKEILCFDYNKEFKDKRNYSLSNIDTFDHKNVKIISYRDFLPSEYFTHLDILRGFENPDKVRVVFSFDC